MYSELHRQIIMPLTGPVSIASVWSVPSDARELLSAHQAPARIGRRVPPGADSDVIAKGPGGRARRSRWRRSAWPRYHRVHEH